MRFHYLLLLLISKTYNIPLWYPYILYKYMRNYAPVYEYILFSFPWEGEWSNIRDDYSEWYRWCNCKKHSIRNKRVAEQKRDDWSYRADHVTDGEGKDSRTGYPGSTKSRRASWSASMEPNFYTSSSLRWVCIIFVSSPTLPITVFLSFINSSTENELWYWAFVVRLKT